MFAYVGTLYYIDVINDNNKNVYRLKDAAVIKHSDMFTSKVIFINR